MFRDGDRRSMQFRFDLWAYDDVSQHADMILARLRAGTMPCDGPWPTARVASSNAGPRAASRDER
jgi:antirestriction protein ArdC